MMISRDRGTAMITGRPVWLARPVTPDLAARAHTNLARGSEALRATMKQAVGVAEVHHGSDGKQPGPLAAVA